MKKILIALSIVLTLTVLLSAAVFADEDDTGEADEIVLFAAEDGEGAENGEGADVDVDDAKSGDDVGAANEDILTVGASDEDAAADGDGAADSAPEVIAAADDAAAAEEEATGTWDNLGTSGIIGIIVAVVVAVAAVITIIVLIPKKGGQKRK